MHHFLICLVILLGQFSFAQDFHEIEVRQEKKNYVLYNAETDQKIAKLCSVKKRYLDNGIDAVWAINRYIVGSVKLKKDQKIFTVYNAKGELPQKFSYIQRINTKTGFNYSTTNRNYIVERFPYFSAIPIEVNNNFGVYQLDGSEIIPASYNSIEIYHIAEDNTPYFCVRDRVSGYGIYFKDQILIPAKHLYIEAIELDYFIPFSDNRSNGVYNILGELIIDFNTNDIVFNQDSTLTVRVDEVVGLLDKNGQVLIPIEYDYIGKIEGRQYNVEQGNIIGIYDIDSQKIISYKTIAEESYDTNNNDEVYTIVDQMPVFPGGKGDAGIGLFIAQNTIYPPMALDNDIEGKVYVKFIVDKRGKVRDVEIAKGADPILNQEALRVVNKLPDFTPGMQDGKPVKVQYVVPLNFKVQ